MTVGSSLAKPSRKGMNGGDVGFDPEETLSLAT